MTNAKAVAWPLHMINLLSWKIDHQHGKLEIGGEKGSNT